jgi:ribosomal protein S18 acetylase RimI-like enzyme
MEKDYKIREAKIEDIEHIVGIWGQLMELHAGLDGFFQRREGAEEAFAEFVKQNIRDENKVVVVAEFDGRIVGYCQGSLEKHPPALEKRDYGQVSDTAVDAEYRRGGAGEAMVRHVCRWFKEKGMSRVEVRFHVKNEISSSFWPKMGFEVYIKTAFAEI